jgi:hypothetical protein
MRLYFIIGITLIFLACADNSQVKDSSIDRLFYNVPASISGINFQNDFIETPEKNQHIFDYYCNGSGVAIGDFNNDGLSDIFFTGNDVSNRLFLNKGNLKFEDITEKAGLISDKWSNGVTVVDFNHDGFLDLYISNGGPFKSDYKLSNDLYINQGDLSFKEMAKDFGINDIGRSVQSSFFDMDRDGDLDLWINNHGRIVLASLWSDMVKNLPADEYDKFKLKLYRNDGNGKYTDISESAGVDLPSFGLGLAIADLNEDGWLDVYCANDYFLPDYYFINNKQGKFTEAVKSYTGHISYYSMGCDVSDFNNDGILDLSVVDMTPKDHYRNKLLMESMDVEGFRRLQNEYNFQKQYMFNSFQLGVGYGGMNEIGLQLNISQTEWSWAVLLADFDNDGFKDYFVSNGYVRETRNNDFINRLSNFADSLGEKYSAKHYYEFLKNVESNPIQNAIFKNINGEQFQFVSNEWGLEEKTFSNGAAYGDLDNDGDLDLVINNLKQPALLYENMANENVSTNFIRLKLMDKGLSSPVLHSSIQVFCGNDQFRADNRYVRGYLSTMEPIVHFGIGEHIKIDSIRIKWNDGTVSLISGLKVNETHVLDKSTVESKYLNSTPVSLPFINITKTTPGININHTEDFFDDFKKEVLLPHSYSTMGPCLAVADVNRDGFDDFYLGGSKGYAGRLFIQKEKGFTELTNKSFLLDSKYEDIGASFADFDGDGDMDLYVASGGGGEIENNEDLLQDRLYINDNGKLNRAYLLLPKISSSTKAIAHYDFDQDGDLDIFIGGRNTPGRYPQPARSYFLKNENGFFKDVISEMMNTGQLPGMITDAEFSDLNKNGRIELIITSEWSSPKIFEWNEDRFELIQQSELNELKGWWQSVLVEDLDQDGDQDLVFGNLGLNNKFHPTKEKPLGVLSNDFDQNGSLDIVLTKKYKGETVPVRGKECSTEQMPYIAEKFPLFADFASSNVEDILGEDNITKSLQYEANTFASFIALNEGNNKYKLIELPFEAQHFPILESVCHDFTGDGNLDLVLAGAIHNTEPETPSYDGGRGLLLVGNGLGQFETSAKIDYSGLNIDQNTKAMQLIKLGASRFGILVGNNNSPLELYINIPSNFDAL